jgi:hypothetical protein
MAGILLVLWAGRDKDGADDSWGWPLGDSARQLLVRAREHLAAVPPEFAADVESVLATITVLEQGLEAGDQAMRDMGRAAEIHQELFDVGGGGLPQAEVLARRARAVEALGVMLAGERRLEDSVGSAAVLAPATAQLEVIEGLVIAARGPARPDLVDVAAQWAQFCGWLYAATGDLRAARAQFDRAAEWAAESGNATMGATALSYRGHLAWMAGHIGPLIGLSQAARCEDGRTAARLHAGPAHRGGAAS